MNELVKHNDAYVARYRAEDPFTAFANETGAGIVGTVLRCSKGDWNCGHDKDSIALGTKLLALVDTTTRGWVRWKDGQPAEVLISKVVDNEPMPRRPELGFLDEAEWEAGLDGRKKDPWQPDYRMLLVELKAPHRDFTFVGSSYGTKLAIQDLCRGFGRDRHLYTGAYPVIELAVSGRKTKFGIVKGPQFNIAGWATVEDVKAGRKKLASAKPLSKDALEEELNDALPEQWGKPCAAS